MSSYAIRDIERDRIEVYKVRYAYTQASYFPYLYFQLLCPLATFPMSDDFDVHAPEVEEICNSPARKEHLQVDHWWLRIKSKNDPKSKKTASAASASLTHSARRSVALPSPFAVKPLHGKRSAMPPIKLQPNIVLGASASAGLVSEDEPDQPQAPSLPARPSEPRSRRGAVSVLNYAAMHVRFFYPPSSAEDPFLTGVFSQSGWRAHAFADGGCSKAATAKAIQNSRLASAVPGQEKRSCSCRFAAIISASEAATLQQRRI